MFMFVALALSVSLVTIQRYHVEKIYLGKMVSQSKYSSTTFIERDDNPVPQPDQVRIDIKPAPKPHFDCAISWLRLPKTASTSVAQSFIQPLYRAGKFTNTEVGPNSCIEGVGGCAPYWKGLRWNNSTIARKIKLNNTELLQSIPTPKYVGATSSRRCYPMSRPNSPKMMCQEYDARTMTMNFGPHRRPPKPGPKPGGPPRSVPSQLQAHFDFGPMTATHVGLDPSLFGWVMPEHPMVFSTFRDPIERLLSSFHYGIQFGGGRPGEVDRCELPGAGKGKGRVNRWNAIVVKAREIATLQNNWTEYQSLLRIYLDTCSMAADNAFVQFLDPITKDVNRAVSNLEKYVIVGLQNDMDETMKRWINITKSSCRTHPMYRDMDGRVFQKILDSMQRNGGFDRKRESTVDLKPKRKSTVDLKPRRTQTIRDTAKRALSEDDLDILEEEPKPRSDIKLVSPDVSIFEDDLQELIKNLTAGDAVVYQRVLELYEEQRYWGL